MKIRIATRKSPLAVWQAEHVSRLLKQNEPGLETELVLLSTKGDRILDQALSKVGGKDLFVKEIEEAVLDGRAQIAVHSLKDMPTDLPEGLAITAYPAREDPRDALVSTKGYTLATLPQNARLGTSSLRRAAQLLRARPDLQIVPIRGNVQTRMRKLDEDDLAATVLAYAGLLRLGLERHATDILESDVSLPAIGQGILAIETRADDSDTVIRVGRLDDPDTRVAATTERAFLHTLRGGCQVPIAGHAVVMDGRVSMRGLVASLDGKEVFEAHGAVDAPQGATLGERLAHEVLEQGANRVLDEILK